MDQFTRKELLSLFVVVMDRLDRIETLQQRIADEVGIHDYDDDAVSKVESLDNTVKTFSRSMSNLNKALEKQINEIHTAQNS